MQEDKSPLWEPTQDEIDSSNLTNYISYLTENYNLSFSNYDQLYQWSISDIENFWKSIWEYSKIIHSKNYTSIIDKNIMPGAKWFSGAELNFAQNLLRYSDNRIAIISVREDQPNVKISYALLNKLVAKCAAGLRKLGLKKGDRVAGFVTNYPESVIAMLAVASIGGIWSSCSPDFGIQGVYDRFGQIKPKILFAIEEYHYNGKKINCKEKVKQIAHKIPQIEYVILIPQFENLSKLQSYKTNEIDDDKILYFNSLLANNSSQIDFEQLPFNHPVYIMYSSGTTGLPKCMVHGSGGTLLQHFKEHCLHTNIKREDIIFYFTTCGWMMWNWLISSLQNGATLVLYDGSPIYPDDRRMWQLIDELKITVFGTSPKFLSLCKNSGLEPTKLFKLDSLKTILSTGSPLTSDNYRWIYSSVKKDVMLSSISGGTDIISCFMLGNPIISVYEEEIQCRGLGMSVKAFDENGNEVIEEKGELVCTKPFPSMPVYFWDDKHNEKYFNSYFSKYSGVWTHGDYIKITKSGSVIVYGRSDATLNPGGVRIGTAEIYRVVETMDEIKDSLVVGRKSNGDVKVILFVLLNDKIKLTLELIQKIKKNIKELTTPRHVPSAIYQVNAIPHTISGKKVEIAVTKILDGETVENKEALANPESLKEYYNFI